MSPFMRFSICASYFTLSFVSPEVFATMLRRYTSSGETLKATVTLRHLFFLSRFFADIIYVLHDFIEPFCNGNQIFLIRFVENDLILPMLLHAGFQVVALDGPGDTAEVFVSIHMGCGQASWFMEKKAST